MSTDSRIGHATICRYSTWAGCPGCPWRQPDEINSWFVTHTQKERTRFNHLEFVYVRADAMPVIYVKYLCMCFCMPSISGTQIGPALQVSSSLPRVKVPLTPNMLYASPQTYAFLLVVRIMSRYASIRYLPSGVLSPRNSSANSW